MPYIKKDRRPRLRYPLIKAAKEVESGGDLNYCFSILCQEFVKKYGESYSIYSECISSLECAKLELYRRHVAPYEDKKIVENGDI